MKSRNSGLPEFKNISDIPVEHIIYGKANFPEREQQAGAVARRLRRKAQCWVWKSVSCYTGNITGFFTDRVRIYHICHAAREYLAKEEFFVQPEIDDD